MSSTLSFLDQFNAPSTEGGKRLSIYTPKHTHVGDSTLLTLLLSNPTDVFNKLKAHNPEATNATDRAALEAYLSARREYDEAVKAADEAIDHHKRLLRQQDDRVLTELIRLDNLKAPPDPIPFSPSNAAEHYHPGRLVTQPWLDPKGKLQAMRIVSTLGCGKEAPGHLERECGTRPMKRHVSAPPEEPARRMGVVVDNVFLEGIINEAKERKEKERQTKAIPIPPPRSANPEPPTSPITGPSRPRPDTPVVFRKVDPDWTPDTTQWTWDSSWPNQKHLSGEEWMNVGRNARKEWFDEEEDDGVDWELYGDGEQVGTCEFAEIDIRDGKCKRNTEGKIVLPNGSFCPRTIPGLTIRDRIYEWHRRNPAAPAAPTMLFEIDDRSTVQTFTLNTSGRIEALERELLQLRKRREVFDGVEILQRKKPTTTAVPKSAEASGSGTSKGVAAPSSTSTSTAPPPTIPAAAPTASSSSSTQSTSHPITKSAPPAPPVHPFANARDATYAPPNVRNFATPPKPSNDKGKEPAYKTIVPVIQPKLAEEIFQHSMKSQFVTLTPEELLSIAPDVRTKYRDAVTPKRVSTEPVASAHIVEIGADEEQRWNPVLQSSPTPMKPI
ncbi:predicted protein [Postia placenta Mad-698-R]|nr:predicted protein [Postia placenta Mad-698-R]